MTDDHNHGRRLAPYVKGSITSEKAARGQKPGKVRNIVIAIIALYRTGDFTVDEALRQLDEKGDNYSGVTPRFTTCRRARILEGTGTYRRTSRGASAEVLRLVPGATIETYDAYLRGETPEVLDFARWKKALLKSALAHAANPTVENHTALMKVVMAGAQFLESSAPAAQLPRKEEPPMENAQTVDPMDWAMGLV